MKSVFPAKIITKEEIIVILKNLKDYEAAWSGYLLTAQSTARKSLIRLCPSIKEPENISQTIADFPPTLFARAVLELRSAAKTVSHENFIDEYCALSNLTDDIEVSYSAGKLYVSQNEKGVTIGSEEEVETFSQESYIVSHTVVCGEVKDKKLPEVAMNIARKIDFVADLTNHKVAARKLSQVTYKIDGISQGIASTLWADQLYQATGFTLPEGHTPLNRPFMITQMPAFIEVSKALVQYKFELTPPRIPNYINLAQGTKIMGFLIGNQEMKKNLKFYDIPRQWMNAPMKWGAVTGYLNRDITVPETAPSGSVYFGAAGDRAAAIFQHVEEQYDIKKRKFTVPYPKKMSQELKDRLDSKKSDYRIRDIFEYELPKKTFLFSDVWSTDFGNEQLDYLINLVTINTFIKFSADFSTLYSRLVEKKKFNLVILNFGRPLTMELILTVHRPVNFEEQLRMYPNYIFDCRDEKDLFTNFMRIQKRKIFLLEQYKMSHVGAMRKKIAIEYRPFTLNNWMIPLLVTSEKGKKLETTKMLSFKEIGMIFDHDDLVDFDDQDFEEFVDGIERTVFGKSKVNNSNNNNNNNNNDTGSNNSNSFNNNTKESQAGVGTNVIDYGLSPHSEEFGDDDIDQFLATDCGEAVEEQRQPQEKKVKKKINEKLPSSGKNSG